MTAYFWDDSSSTSGSPLFALGDGDSLVAAVGSKMFGGDASPITLAGDNYVRIDGAVYATGFTAISQIISRGGAAPAVGAVELHIGATGVVSSELNAVSLGAGAFLDNAGVLSGGPTTVSIMGAGVIDNSGSIEATGTAVSFGAGSTLFNSGVIHGAEAVDAQLVDNINVQNFGLLAGFDQGLLMGHASSLRNHGQIEGGAGAGVTLTSGLVQNIGDIDGTYGISTLSGVADIVTINNGGDIHGSIFAISGSDGIERIVNNGLIEGQINLAGGNDTYRGIGQVTGVISGGDGSDVLRDGDGADWVNGDAGKDTLAGGGGNDSLDGGDDNDSLMGQTGDDSITGGAGDDVMAGAAGDDVIFGGSGKDVLTGGGGDDFLNGGADKDTFQFDRHSGHDVISDFTAGNGTGHDVIRMGLQAFVNFADVQAHMTQVGVDVLITIDADDTILIQNVHTTDFTSQDFIFGP